MRVFDVSSARGQLFSTLVVVSLAAMLAVATVQAQNRPGREVHDGLGGFSTISSISPSSVAVGAPGFTLAVTGTQFNASSAVVFGGTALTTTFVSATQLTASVPASLLTTNRTVDVVVCCAGLFGFPSNSVTFTVGSGTPPPPPPPPPPTGQISSINPTSVRAGSTGFTLTVDGSAFTNSHTVQFSGIGLATTFVSSSLLRAVVPATMIQTAGTRDVMVCCGPSNTVPFTIEAALAPLAVSACPSNGAFNVAYRQQVAATGGKTPYRFRLSSGTLPRGITLASDGVLGGTPAEAGQFSATLEVTDGDNRVSTRNCGLMVTAPYSAGPANVTFRAASLGPATPWQVISLISPAPGLGFTSSITVPWLQTRVKSGAVPGIEYLMANPSLNPGTYTTTVNFNATAGNPPAQSVRVTLIVDPPEPPRIRVDPARLAFAVTSGAGTVRRVLLLANRRAAALNWIVETPFSSPADAWFTAPASGSTAAGAISRLVISVLTDRLRPDRTYRESLFIRNQVSGERIEVPILAAVSSARRLETSHGGFTVDTELNGPAPPPLFVDVNDPEARASISLLSGADWLSIGAITTLPDGGRRFELRLRPDGLAAGDHDASVVFTSTASANSREVRVTQRVTPPATPLAPILSPAALLFTGSGTQSVQIANPRRTPMTIETQDADLTFPQGRVIAPGASVRMEVRMNAAGFKRGVFERVFPLTASGGSGAVGLIVKAVIPADVTAADRQAGNCIPTALSVLPSAQPLNFLATGGATAPLEALVVDDCGDPLTTGIVTVIPSNDEPAVNLVHGGQGRWRGSWPVRQLTASAVNLTYVADDVTRTLTGNTVAIGALAATPDAPVIGDGGVVSTASFAAGSPLAPGSLAAIFGVGLASGTSAAAGLPLGPQLGSTRAAIGSREMPLFFSGNLGTYSQVNGMLPYGLAPNTSHQLYVRNGSRRSNAEEVFVAAAQPAVFSANQSGSGQAVIVDGANPGMLADATAPIERGGVLIIYCEGLGATDPPVVEGEAAPASPLAVTASPASVRIGGVEAEVVFAGLTPFFTGLYQLNVKVPTAVAPGNAVPVVVTIAGQSSRALTIAVK